MLSLTDMRDSVIRPVLQQIELYSPAAEALLLATALAESGLSALRQVRGPALGLFQMEPATHDDIFENYLAYRPALGARLKRLAAPWPAPHAQLATNPAYAAALCRLHYRRVPVPLPPLHAPDDMAAYWKAHYNTSLGKGRAGHFAAIYKRHVLPLYSLEA